MAPDAFMEKLQEILEHLTRAGLQRPLLFACIAADGYTMTGSSTTDGSVVVTHPDQEELPLPINLLFVDATANAQHVAISQPDDG
jgi:hypothetical protein